MLGDKVRLISGEEVQFGDPFNVICERIFVRVTAEVIVEIQPKDAPAFSPGIHLWTGKDGIYYHTGELICGRFKEHPEQIRWSFELYSDLK